MMVKDAQETWQDQTIFKHMFCVDNGEYPNGLIFIIKGKLLGKYTQKVNMNHLNRMKKNDKNKLISFK